MRPSGVIGGVAGLFLTVVVIGGAILTAVNATAAGGVARPWLLDALGVAWMVSLWASFAVGSVFFIAWVADGLAPDGGF